MTYQVYFGGGYYISPDEWFEYVNRAIRVAKDCPSTSDDAEELEGRLFAVFDDLMAEIVDARKSGHDLLTDTPGMKAMQTVHDDAVVLLHRVLTWTRSLGE